MKFSIEQDVFYDALDIVTSAVSSKNALPVLEGVLIESNNGKLDLITTDLDIGIYHSIPADIEEDGAIVLPAKQLVNIVKELPSGNIDVFVDDNNVKVEMSKSKFSLKQYSPEEFPQVPDVDEKHKIKLSALKLKEMVDSVKFACAKSESRPALVGTLCSISPDKVIMVSTNTYRLAYKEILVENDSLEEEVSVILPEKTLQELSKLISGDDDEEIEIQMGENHFKFNLEDTVLTSRLIQGKFPDYENVIPENFITDAVADKNKFRQACKRVSLISDTIEMSFENTSDKLVLQSRDSDKGHAREEMPIELEGDPQEISVDVGYLQDVMKVFSEDEIEIRLNDTLKPLVIREVDSEDYLYLVMPIRPRSQ